MTGEVRLVRVYDWARWSRPGAREGGRAFFVERLWPRGFRKADLAGVVWLRDIAPSVELRRWYGHDASRWAEFGRRYHAELDADPTRAEPLLAALRAGDDVTLLYASKETERTSAAVLRRWLLDRLG
jgi:uncharacterized protein YeaO (DUF488 family)